MESEVLPSGISSSLNASAPPFVSTYNNHCSAPKTSGTENKAKNKKPKNGAATDHESLELEYAKYAVNVTQAKLRTLESTNREIKFRNSILQSRVQELENKQKQDIYERYFPRSDDVTNSKPKHSQSHPHSCFWGSSHLVLSCCSSSSAGGHSQPYEQPPQQYVTEQIVCDIVSQMGEIKTATADLKCKFDTILDKLDTYENKQKRFLKSQ